MKHGKSFILIIYVMVFSFNVGYPNPNEDPRVRKIYDQFSEFNNNYPQQTVFLHLDKHEYSVGEIIWFKAYLLNAATNRPDSISTNLYVELINPRNELSQIIRLRMKNGFGHGDFLLRDTLDRGMYRIRAYTSWMKNFDESLMYVQSVEIKNPQHKVFKEDFIEYKKINRKIKRNSNLVHVRFFPEGGDLISGLENRIALEISDGLGKKLSPGGKILSDKDEIITSFSVDSTGITTFKITPQYKKKYYAVIDIDNKEEKYLLPEAKEYGYVLTVDQGDKIIRGTISTNRILTSDKFANEVILTGQSGGRIYFADKYFLDRPQLQFSVETNSIPTGVLQLTLFDGRGLPVCERLVFINHYDLVRVALVRQKESTGNKGHQSFFLSLEHERDKFPEANISVAFIDDNAYNPETEGDNILSHILLNAGLSSTIKNGNYYLTNHSNEAKIQLDQIMLTKGWRRFDWEKLIAGEFPRIKFNNEKGITISGQITRELFRIPLKDAMVKLTILNAYNDFYTQETGKDGRFEFDHLFYYDTLDLKLEANKQNGRKNLVIYLDEFDEEDISHTNYYSEYTRKDIKRPVYKYSSSNFTDKEEEEEDRMPSLQLYNEPDQVIYMKDIPGGQSSLLEILKGRVPGLNISGNKATIRGVSSFYANTDPLLLIDGVPSDFRHIDFINPEDVERIEILKGPSASIYGSRGGNGVIAIYTKRGRFMTKGELDFQVLGYHVPREFYSSLNTSNNLSTNRRKSNNATIFWNPEVITNEYGHAQIDLVSEKKEGFKIIVQGITMNGKGIFRVFDF